MHMFVCLMVVLGLLRLCSGSFLLFVFWYSEFIISIFPSLCSPNLFFKPKQMHYYHSSDFLLQLLKCLISEFLSSPFPSPLPFPVTLLPLLLFLLFQFLSLWNFWVYWESNISFLFLWFYSLCLTVQWQASSGMLVLVYCFPVCWPDCLGVSCLSIYFFLKNENKAPNTHYDLFW